MTDQPPPTPSLSPEEAAAALQWLVDMGADEAMADAPINRFVASKSKPTPAQARAPQPAAPRAQPQRASLQKSTLSHKGSLEDAQKAAGAAGNLDALQAALEGFDGGSLKTGAKSCVFADGVSAPDVMVVGEAPGADEDRAGKPFVGVSGQLLDKILASVGLTRTENTRIANVIPWRPLGNRTPDKETIALYLPFLQRHIELAKPKLVLCVGKVPTAALTGKDDAMSRLRGKAYDISLNDHSCAMIATYHPAYLLRTPEAKAHVWRDMLLVKKILKENTTS